MHSTTFDYLSPTPVQLETMGKVRTAVKELAEILDNLLPNGPDKTYLLRKLREVGMWANVTVTREADGKPRY